MKIWKLTIKDYDRWSGPSSRVEYFPHYEEQEARARREAMVYPKDRSSNLVPDEYTNADLEVVEIDDAMVGAMHKQLHHEKRAKWQSDGYSRLHSALEMENPR